MSETRTTETATDQCICGHARNVHGFGMGRCWPCDLAATFMDEECDWFRLTADSPGRPS